MLSINLTSSKSRSSNPLANSLTFCVDKGLILQGQFAPTIALHHKSLNKIAQKLVIQ